MRTQTQQDRLDSALFALNEQMRGYIQYEIVTSIRGCMSLHITSAESGRGRQVLYLGNDIDRAAADIAVITEWEENRWKT